MSEVFVESGNWKLKLEGTETGHTPSTTTGARCASTENALLSPLIRSSHKITFMGFASCSWEKKKSNPPITTMYFNESFKIFGLCYFSI